jgi:hypothetical protein
VDKGLIRSESEEKTANPGIAFKQCPVFVAVVMILQLLPHCFKRLMLVYIPAGGGGGVSMTIRNWCKSVMLQWRNADHVAIVSFLLLCRNHNDLCICLRCPATVHSWACILFLLLCRNHNDF